MATRTIDTTPFWSISARLPQYAALTEDVSADVAVVGGGITGLTTAYLLANTGKRVVVLERERCASIDTGHTTAHLTMVTDARLRELVKAFGRDHAQAVWDAGLAAISTIEDIVSGNEIDAGFERVDGFLHAQMRGDEDKEAEGLKEDASLARELGFDVEFVHAVPFLSRPGIRVSNQARFHPRAYLAGLAAALTALGGRIYEQSAVDDFTASPRALRANGHTVSCEDVVIATHNPIVGLAESNVFQSKLSLYTSYVVGGRWPHGALPDALWWDTASPYNYLRVQPDGEDDVVIFGGNDHKTGQQRDTEGCYERLEQRLKALIPRIEITYRWSGQVIETTDGLPYIGQSAEHQYTATGYAGNGMTFGTLAGVMIADAIAGRTNPWADLFDPGRKALTRGLWNYLKENVDYPYYMIRDRFAGADTRSLREVQRGEGKIVDHDGAKVAAFRDRAGVLTLRSAKCTHMGCTVAWNPAERTWDCPCHGSRFRPNGDVISGPATSPLEEVKSPSKDARRPAPAR